MYTHSLDGLLEYIYVLENKQRHNMTISSKIIVAVTYPSAVKIVNK